MDPDEIQNAITRENLLRLEKNLDEFEKKLDNYVLNIVFEAFKSHLDIRIKPLERLLYGLVGLVLVSVVTAIVATVVG